MSEGRLALPGAGREDQADFETVVSMLPTRLNAEVEGETGTSVVPITGWSCPDYSIDETGSWPQGGAYTFTAKLPEGYACDPLPAVRVILGGAQAYSLPVTGDGYSFDQDTGILTISNDNGSTAWKSGGIAREAVKEVEIQGGVTSIGELAFYSGWNAVTDGIGGDTAVYTILAVSAGMNGWKYRCAITNYAGTVITEEVTLTVKVPVDGVTLDKSSLTLFMHQEITLIATVKPDDASDKSVSWTSDDPAVASVDANGKVTARAIGTASITAASNDGGKKAVCDITVIADTPANRGSSSSGGSRTPVYGPQSNYAVTGDRISLTMPRADIQSLADSGKVLELSCDTAGMTFGASALRVILAAAPGAGSITFAAAPADLSAFPDVAAFFGSRPVYDFTISSQDRNGVMVRIDVNFPAGSAAISLDYTPSSLEVPGSLFMVYVDGMAWLDKSIYRADGAAGGDVSGRVSGRPLRPAGICHPGGRRCGAAPVRGGGRRP